MHRLELAKHGSLSGELLDNKYQIEGFLGQGGMGAVYRATHLGTRRTVAIKVIHPQFSKNAEFVERFRREAEAAGRLRHPNVVDVTDFGFARTGSGEVAYLVMEYLDGCTLAEVLEEEKSLPSDWVVDVLEQTCSAVGEAHRLGIIHRDLKPENIWLEPNRRGGYTIKVLDFGLAKLGVSTIQEMEGARTTAGATGWIARSTIPEADAQAGLAPGVSGIQPPTLLQAPAAQEPATLIQEPDETEPLAKESLPPLSPDLCRTCCDPGPEPSGLSI
jgi:serine/threonine protein kinase